MNTVFRNLVYGAIALLCIFGGFIGFTVYSLPDVTALTTENPQTTAFIEYRLDQAESDGLKLPIVRHWMPLSEIPRLLQRTVIVAEDAAFWQHQGVDWHEVRESINRNLKEGKAVRGASTITQQTAKNLYLSPEKSLYRKFREYLIARQMEEKLSKERILEIYLNSIEFGRGIFGIRSAAQIHFQKHPFNLTISEMVRLAAIIPNPLGISPVRAGGELRWRSYEILRRLRAYDFISEAEYQSTREEFLAFFGS